MSPAVPTTTIGPFDLVRRIARGGMGEVWEARHRTTPVALKFLTTPDAEARALFAEEVRAHACLRHPFVLDVLDLGRVEQRFADPELPRMGTPWIALELASAGTLSSHVDTLDWAGTRVVLLAILDALAHAHAHGVVHRDLKPGNILLAGPTDLRPGVKLADFGIAHRMETNAETLAETLGEAGASDIAFAGTPTTMAPEQCRAALRDTGAWTDLYALGCIATRLVSGRWPFQGLRGHARLLAHIRRPPRPLEPRFAVPDGVSEWVARALAKDPADRWGCAAHAMDALLAMEPASDTPLQDPSLEATRLSLAAATPGRTWRRPLATPLPAPLLDAGLQLFPLRRHPTFGRESERDAMWDVLERTASTGVPHCVVLAGAPGAGSTHLAHWTTIAAHARGIASTQWTRCAADDAPDQALRRLVAELLQTHGLSGQERLDRIAHATRRWNASDPAFVQVLESVLAGTANHGTRRGAVRRLLCEVARDRPMVAAFSHAGTALDVLRFVQVTLDNPVQAPVLFVLDLGDASLAGRHAEVFDALAAHDRTEVLQLGPLAPRDAEEMVRQQLPLPRTVLRQLLVATEGWPGRIVGRLRELAQSDALRPGRYGFELAEGFALHTITRDTAPTSAEADLDRLLAPLPERTWPVLLRAAVLGSDVRAEAWTRVCDDPDGTAPQHAIPMLGMKTRFDLVDRMTRCGFAEEGADHSWHFVQPALRDAILQRGRADGTIREAHADVARYLDTEPDLPRRHHRRIAHHRAAGHLDEAFAAALDGIAEDRGHRLDHITAARSLLPSVDLPADDPRRGWIDAWHLRCLHAGDTREVQVRARRLLEDAERYDWPVPAACAHAWLGFCGADPHHPDATDAHLSHVMDALDRLPPSPLLLGAGGTVVDALLTLMREEDALVLLRRLLSAAAALGRATLHDRLLAIDAQIRSHHPSDRISLDELLDRAQRSNPESAPP